MTSRFFAAGSSDSESSGSDDSSSYSSDDKGNQQNQWVALSDSDSSEDEVRVVKSGKERALETFQTLISSIKTAMKKRDYFEIQTQFDELSKAMIKAKQYLADGVPRPLVRILCELEDYITERLKDKEQFKKLSARQGRALNRMKLTLKKHNKAYEVVMNAYRQNPTVSDSEADSSDQDESKDSGSSSDESSGSSGSSKSSGSSSSSSSDSSESDSGEESEWASDRSGSSSSDSDDNDAYKGLTGRARWLKKNTAVVEKVVKNKDERAKARAEARAQAETEKAEMEAITASKSVLPEEGLTISVLNKKVAEVVSVRGRKSKDLHSQLRVLEALSRLALQFGPRVEIPILMYAISAQFNLQRTLDDYMDSATWKSCAAYLERITNALDDGYTLVVEQVDAADRFAGKSKMKAALKAEGGAMQAVATDEKLVNPHTGDEETEDERAERLRLEGESKMSATEKKQIPIVGSLLLHLTRLEEEYTKSLQRTSHHSPEYITRLRDESKLIDLLSRFQTYFEQQDMMREAGTLAQLRIEHIYYRHDTIAKQVDRAALFYEKFGEASMLHPACIISDEALKGGSDFKSVHPASIEGKPVVEDPEETDFAHLMTELTRFVYKFGDEQAKTRTTICQIYHHALHDRFTEARDLLLMSHLQDHIYNCGNTSTMILYNRMLVTLGMAAFRLGRINEAHQCLSEICSGRVRELLAQGMQSARFTDKSEQDEKAEKRRQVPYHMHINLELLEACHLISAMLLEVPNMAAAALNGDMSSGRRARIISRSFRKFYDQYNHQVFTGPPEQTRDFVMRASMALKRGDWKACSDLLTSLDLWNLIPGDNAQQQIVDMLVGKIKVEALRTYLFSFSAQYDSLSLTQLCRMFEMNKSEIHSIVSKMMINRELYASWDQPTETIVLRKIQPTSLQLMALQFAEKAQGLIEANERLIDSQNGSYGYKDEHWKEDDRWQHRDGNRYQNRNGGGGQKFAGKAGFRNRGRR